VNFMYKAILIGRHSFLDAQEKELKKAKIKIVYEIRQLNDIWGTINKAKELGAKFIIVTALPYHLMKSLYKEATKRRIKIIVAEMEGILLTEDEEKARKLVNEAPDRRVALPPPRGDIVKTWRVVEFKGWKVIRMLRVKDEDLLSFLQR